jgi:cytochrome b561
MKPDRWSTGMVILHWVMVALLVATLTLGWVASDYPRSPFKVTLFVWHKSLGITVLGFVLVRLLVRWRVTAPDHGLERGERILARCVQAGLYLCMIVMPLSGWVINSASDFPLKIFWLARLPAITAPSTALQEAAETVHLVALYLMLGLVSTHVAAAFRHHFIRKNEVMRSMLPRVNGLNRS